MELKPLASPGFHPSRRLLGRAIKIPPEQLVESIQPRFIFEMPSLATDYALDRSLAAIDTTDDEALGRHQQEISHAGTLAASLEDMMYVLGHALDSHIGDHSNFALEEAIRIARHSQTVMTFADLALLPSVAQKGETDVIQRLPPAKYWIDAQEECLRANVVVNKRTPRRCPFAGFNTEEKIDPLFVKYTRWAGEVAVRTYQTASY